MVCIRSIAAGCNLVGIHLALELRKQPWLQTRSDPDLIAGPQAALHIFECALLEHDFCLLTRFCGANEHTWLRVEWRYTETI